MQIDWWTLGLQTVNVLVLIWLLSRFLFKPISQIIAQRRAEIEKLVADARAAKAAAEAERDKAKAEEARLAAERGARMEAVAQEAEAQKAALLSAAKTETDALRAAAQAAIAREQASEEEAAADRASRLAVDIAAKLLDRLPDDARVAGFIDGLAQGLEALPEASRAVIGADGAPVRLAAARALTPEEEEACRARFSAALGRPVTLAVTVDPALIAGLEMETPHAVVRNSFKADLNRVTAALTHHGT